MYVMKARQSRTRAPRPDLATVARRSLRVAGLGSTLLASLLLGLGVGWMIDRSCDSSPWGMTISSLVFIIAGLYQVVKAVLRCG